MNVEKEDPHRHSKRKSSLFSDLFNVLFFLAALAALLAVLTVLDPSIKRWLLRFLP